MAEHYEDILDFYFTNQILSDWTYMYADSFESEEAVRQCLEDYEKSQNPYFFAIRDNSSSKVLGTFSLMAITPKNRSVEMGRVILAPVLQKTRASTEAQYLLMKYIFEDLNYRRYEWKCDSLNRPSANAAIRLGFIYEECFVTMLSIRGVAVIRTGSRLLTVSGQRLRNDLRIGYLLRILMTRDSRNVL